MGDVTGAPTQSGSFSVTITATDAGACTGTKNLTVVVKAPPAITSANSYTQQLGTALSFTVTTSGPPSGGFPTAAISQAPTGGQTGFPGSVSFTDNGNGTATLGGSVTSGGAQTYTTTITANNGVAPNATQSFSLIITCPTITVTRTGGGSFPAATFGVGYPAGNSFTATGGSGSYHWAFAPGGQPPGINLTIAAGSLSGIPTGTGNFNMIVVATDQSTGCTGQATFPFTINPKIINDTYSNLVNNTEAVVTGGTTSSPTKPFVPLSGTLVSNDTPSGNVTLTTVGTFATSQGGSVTIAADGTFKYTPPVTVTALSTDTFTYPASSNFPGPCGTCAVSTGPSSASGTSTRVPSPARSPIARAGSRCARRSRHGELLRTRRTGSDSAGERHGRRTTRRCWRGRCVRREGPWRWRRSPIPSSIDSGVRVGMIPV